MEEKTNNLPSNRKDLTIILSAEKLNNILQLKDHKMEPESSALLRLKNQINSSELMKVNQDPKNMCFILIVVRFWMLLKKERKMEHKLFNGIIMVAKINCLISVNPVTSHHPHQKWIDQTSQP